MKFTGIVRLKPRKSFVLRGLGDFSDDLALFGESVGPRFGASRRTNAEREDWCLRRYLIAIRKQDHAPFPIGVAAFVPDGTAKVPDYVLEFGDGSIVGIEVTEATEEDFQYELAVSVRDELRVGLREEGYSGDEAERLAIRSILGALERKSKKLVEGHYSDVPVCELLIYENYRSRIVTDQKSVAAALAQYAVEAPKVFGAVHLLRDDSIMLDVFGKRQAIDFSGSYEHDYASWLESQARLARGRKLHDLDLAHIAEELEALARNEERALRSQFRRLLQHLLKWQFQPARRGASWTRTILSARDEIEDRLSTSPKFAQQGLLTKILEQEYARARRNALREIKLPSQKIPLTCPYSVEDLLDEDFPWGESIKP